MLLVLHAIAYSYVVSSCIMITQEEPLDIEMLIHRFNTRPIGIPWEKERCLQYNGLAKNSNFQAGNVRLNNVTSLFGFGAPGSSVGRASEPRSRCPRFETCTVIVRWGCHLTGPIPIYLESYTENAAVFGLLGINHHSFTSLTTLKST